MSTPLLGSIFGLNVLYRTMVHRLPDALNVPRYNELLVSWYEVAESLEALEQVLADKPVSKA